jgi:hypothetical protein
VTAAAMLHHTIDDVCENITASSRHDPPVIAKLVIFRFDA